ncbi:signal transduction histidine kinase [Spirosoma oryzae]|uniref:histidine kinase n=1 Tax=Spirosoma oryzae TaxID=1469603 RepID=A0A2T0TEX8_9BACT|nr:two-component regulator propeller domain-containing protein [Spirosoma oryzae]PRY44219.1 signal transduction histidine kinase [Spirosoma oryzae]
MWFRKYIHWLTLVFGTILPSLAQQSPDQFRFEHITIDRGLSHSDAMCVAQDRSGFIWIGTNKGINRYDGYALKTYNLPVDTARGVSANRIRTLHVDSYGTLWAGVERAGLFWYDADTDRFRSITNWQSYHPGGTESGTAIATAALDLLWQTNVHAITSDRRGRLWVATQRNGVVMLQFGPGGRLLAASRIRLTGQADKEPTINKLALDSGGTLWIGTLGHGLWRFNTATGRPAIPLQAVPVPAVGGQNIRAIHSDRQTGLWVGTDDRVYWAAAPNLQSVSPPAFQPLHRTFADVESLFLDSFHRLWVSTHYGLLLMEGKPRTADMPPIDETQVHAFLPSDADPYSINSVRIHDILEDQFHNLWLATSAGGLNQLRLRAKPFQELRQPITGPVTPANDYINAICKDDAANRLWIGTRNGLASYDLSTQTYHNYLMRPGFATANGLDVSALFLAADHTLWIGTRYGGLYTFRPGQDRPGQDRLPRRLSAGRPGLNWRGVSIESITEDRFGTIWVATFNAGMHRFSRQGRYLMHYDRTNNILPTHQLTALLYDTSRNVLWASTRDAGLLKLRPQADSLLVLNQFLHQPGNPNSLLVNYTWPLLDDGRGNLWIGTIGGGLHRLTTGAGGQEHVVRYQQRIPETDIESLLADNAGNLWIGGAGLYKFSPKTDQLLHFDVTDGLQSNSFKVGAAYRSTDGTLYFGGTNGITAFQPRSIHPNPYPPLVQITGLRVQNQSVAPGDTVNGRVLIAQAFAQHPAIRLNASENDFAIDFVGLNYANPQKQRYAYQLEGYNDTWVYPAPDQRVATFSNLPAGAYTFRVKASNDDGIWSPKEARLTLTILPPWWRTWWAYLLYVSAFLGTLWFYRRTELRQQALQNKLALEQYKAEKEKEMTDSRLRFFTNVSHELRTPLTLILGPMDELVSTAGLPGAQVRERILLMQQQTRKLLDLVNQLLDFRKAETGHITLRASRDNVIPFLTEIVLIFKLKAEELRLDYALHAPAEPIWLYFDRSKLEIMLTNLLSNAFKYTPEGSRIRVTVACVGSPDSPATFLNDVLQDNYLQIIVRDWGIGMPADQVDKVFDPYYQASHTETLRVTGTGLGLSLVKQFTDAHRGTVSVQSTIGMGTTFIMRLPFGHAHLPPDAIRAEKTADETAIPATLTASIPLPDNAPVSSPVRAAHVLLVEDNDELRHYLTNLLSPAFTVHSAVDGLDGWVKTLDLLPDIVVSDIMMPRSNGLELCRTIKQHPKTSHIPVVLLTARVAAVHELEGLETGADEYMAKPFNPQVLLTKLSVMLQDRFRLRDYYHQQILLEPTDIVIPDAERQLLEKAMQIVEANLSDPNFSVAVLVREMGMSQSVLYRHIKAITGQTVIEFIRDVRMKHAAQLLTSSSLRISEVAQLVGFEDVKYFRKAFQHLFKLSPSDYAKQHRPSAVDSGE